eukprot:g14224.t1 g14224   contig9:1428205-1428600(+)
MQDTTQCVRTWLTSVGLSYAFPNFEMAGIVSPRSFADLELSYYEPLGVKKPEDRKKLFFLVQKVKGVLEGDESEGSELLGGSSGGEPEDGGESSLSGSLASVGDDQENCNYRENATTNNNAKAGSGRGYHV